MNLLSIDKPTILAIGAHPDDIELGCSGALMRLAEETGARIHFFVLTYGIQAFGPRLYEQSRRMKESAAAFETLFGDREGSEIHFGVGLEDCKLTGQGHLLIHQIEDLVTRICPDVILTHALGDLHADHRETHHATLSAARGFGGAVLTYQAPSTIPNEFRPQLLIEFSATQLKMKRKALRKHISQRDKPFMSSSYVVKLPQAWGAFYRLPPGTHIEAFEVVRAFWPARPNAKRPRSSSRPVRGGPKRAAPPASRSPRRPASAR
jgi:LmbE family N-acetylglucosaminyl deacetylase